MRARHKKRRAQLQAAEDARDAENILKGRVCKCGSPKVVQTLVISFEFDHLGEQENMPATCFSLVNSLELESL